MYVGRKLNGDIYGVWSVQQPNDEFHPLQEELPDDHPDVVAFLAPLPPIDHGDLDNLEKKLKALALCVAQVGGLTPAQMKTMFRTKWDALP